MMLRSKIAFLTFSPLFFWVSCFAVDIKDSLLIFGVPQEVNLLVINQLEQAGKEAQSDAKISMTVQKYLKRWNKIKSIQDCISFLQVSPSVFHTSQKGNTPAEDRFYCILLVGIVEQTTSFCIEKLLNVIDRCEIASRYWKLQKYFDKQQIADRECVRAQACSGSLVMALKNLTITQSNEQLYQWINETATLIITSINETAQTNSVDIQKEAFARTLQALHASKQFNDFF